MRFNADLIQDTGKPHLTTHKGGVAVECGAYIYVLHRRPWNGKSEGVCKRCIKKLTARAVREQLEKRNANH
jgi:hypothetical protein